MLLLVFAVLLLVCGSYGQAALERRNGCLSVLYNADYISPGAIPPLAGASSLSMGLVFPGSQI